MTNAQCRAARALLNLSQRDLALESNLGVKTVVEFERGQRTPHPNNLESMRRALEAAGVEFIPENGGGPGVRLRKL